MAANMYTALMRDIKNIDLEIRLLQDKRMALIAAARHYQPKDMPKNEAIDGIQDKPETKTDQVFKFLEKNGATAPKDLAKQLSIIPVTLYRSLKALKETGKVGQNALGLYDLADRIAPENRLI